MDFFKNNSLIMINQGFDDKTGNGLTLFNTHTTAGYGSTTNTNAWGFKWRQGFKRNGIFIKGNINLIQKILR